MPSHIPHQIARQFTGERRLGGRTYYLMQPLGRHGTRHKVFLPEGGPDGDFRVLHEFDSRTTSKQHMGVLQALARESNGSFPSIMEFCIERNRIYVITDWVRGHSLREHLDDARQAGNAGAKRMTVGSAVSLFGWFVSDLCRLHRTRNLVHGDLKPENLIVRRRPNRLVMIDFGSAWRAERTAGRDPGDGVSRDYAAPEAQSAGAPVDYRADIFSASAIFFEMLTLTRPFGGVGGKVAHLPPEYAETYEAPSRWLPPETPPALREAIDSLVTRGLQRDPAMRYASGSQWLCDIQVIRAQMSVGGHVESPSSSRRKGPVARLAQWLRQRGDARKKNSDFPFE
jgi:serine/threonine protein kinase